MPQANHANPFALVGLYHAFLQKTRHHKISAFLRAFLFGHGHEALALAGILSFAGIVGCLAVALAFTRIDTHTVAFAGLRRGSGDRRRGEQGGGGGGQSETVILFDVIMVTLFNSGDFGRR